MKITIVNICVTIVLLFALSQQAMSGNVAYGYDPLGRLSNITYGSGTQIIYTYDSIGNRIEEIVAADGDGDGVPDYLDNCVIRSNPGQVDTIGKGFGDACNFDIDDNGIVDFGDVITLLASVNPPTTGVSLGDLDDNGIIDFGDLITLLGFLNQPLGPSCDPLVADPAICSLQ